MEVIQKDIKVVFPVHPRTMKMIKNFKMTPFLKRMENLLLVEPLGYLDFTKLMASSRLIMTDSGGIQEESTVLNIPCITLRENTERSITVEQGTNSIVGNNTEKILSSVNKFLGSNKSKGKPNIPKYWDGKASKRIVKVLIDNLKL